MQDAGGPHFRSRCDRLGCPQSGLTRFFSGPFSDHVVPTLVGPHAHNQLGMWVCYFGLVMLMVAAPRRGRARMSFFLSLHLWFVGGWGGGVGGGVGDVNVHGTCTLTWCYATARSLQGIQLRDATLLHVLFKVYNYVMLRDCTFSSRYTTTWCYATACSPRNNTRHDLCTHTHSRRVIDAVFHSSFFLVFHSFRFFYWWVPAILTPL